MPCSLAHSSISLSRAPSSLKSMYANRSTLPAILKRRASSLPIINRRKSNLRPCQRLFTSYAPISTRRVVLDLLRTVESPHQIRQYLSAFSSPSTQHLAVIAVEDESFADGELPGLSYALAFLAHLGLLPVVIHGELGRLVSRHHGSLASASPDDRDCPPNMLNRVRAANMRLVTSLEDAGIRAQPINSGVFSAVKSSSEQSRGDEPLGSPTAVSRRAIDSAIRTGCVPVLSSLGLSDSGQVLRLDVAQATVQLSQLLQPLKVIFLLEERKMVEAKSVQSSKNFIPFLTQEAKGEVQHHNPRFEIAERRPTLVAVKEIVESLAGSSSIFLARAANLIEALLAGTASRQLGERPWVVLRKAREFRVVTSVWQFEDLGAVKSVLRRHWQAQGMANASEAAERFVLCLRNRRFVAYFDKDPMENLAIVFLDSTHSWKADAAMRMPELSVFAISSQGWMDEVAEQLWARVNEDHKSVWGTIHDKDHSLEWWLTKVNGSIRRAPEVIFWCGEPELSHSVEEMLESENLLVAAVAA